MMDRRGFLARVAIGLGAGALLPKVWKPGAPAVEVYRAQVFRHAHDGALIAGERLAETQAVMLRPDGRIYGTYGRVAEDEFLGFALNNAERGQGVAVTTDGMGFHQGLDG